MNAGLHSSASAGTKATPKSIKWHVSPECEVQLRGVRKQLGEAGYEDTKQALRETLCDYFNLGNCTTQAMQISPMKGAPGGAKALKVRWQLPGCGKSGGLRLAVTVDCERRLVTLCAAWVRKDNPGKAAFQNATSGKQGHDSGK